MKTKILALGLVCLFSFSCASFPWEDLRPKSRRENYVVAHSATLNGDTIWAIRNGRVILGMTYNEVRASLGSPGSINRTTGSWGVHEQWIMDGIGPGQNNWVFYYIYFENGRVTSWQNR